ncbi:MAG: hypothetical protein E6Q58_02955 [Niabella sp.]|nr:MAG: hypothetical protein E6Q58_02955 [Niabella sp.]
MEFYFTRENIEKLLKANPKAIGIIIRQEIKVRKTADQETINIVEITASADNETASRAASAKGGEESVPGCPRPPGCFGQD